MGTSYLFIVVFLVAASIAVPLTRTNGILKRDEESTNINKTLASKGCIFDNNEYKAGDEVPSLGPCERCVCETPNIVCSMVKCQLNSGCRIIQQSGQCCPEYKCDCEYNGRIYNNGERLEKPEDPCQVCYCKGGEIMCTSITCYERDDCKPHFSPGQCCPRYDHCPIETNRQSPTSVRSVNASLYSPKREMQPWPLTKPSNAPSSVNYEESNGSQNNVYPQTIKIVEILPTTPGYTNKPSEVSVIPRVKTNEKDDSKGEALEIVEAASTYTTVTTETYDTSISDSTSEIEHLVETTFTSDSQNKMEDYPERTISTENPLSEYIYKNYSYSEPDSQKYATIHPSYFHIKNKLNNLEVTSSEDVTVTEGSGYDLLKGGIFIDNSSETSSGETESTTGTDSLIHESNTAYIEDLQNRTKDLSKFDIYTVTESFSSEDVLTSTELSDTSTSNISSSDEIDSSGENSEHNSEIQSAMLRNDDLSTVISNSEEKDIFRIPFVNSSESSEYITDSYYVYTSSSSRLPERNPSSYSTENTSEYSTISVNDRLTYTTFPTINMSENLNSREEGGYFTVKEDGTNVTSEMLNMIAYTQNTEEVENVNSTPLYDGSDVNESTTENEYLQITNGQQIYPEARKKSSRFTNSGNLNLEEPSTLTFPLVLNVHTLGYDQIDAQTERTQLENVTSVAKVGIYHPANPNELAGYLTVVDNKTNVSKLDGNKISSHMILTPSDLKKVAEILIQKKIKPVNIYEKNKEIEIPEISYGNRDTYSNSSGPVTENLPSSTPNESGTNNESPLEDSMLAFSETSSETVIEGKKATIGSLNSDKQSSASTKHIVEFPQELVRNLVTSGTLGKEINKNSYSEDPNTSRQIRNPNDGGSQYSAPLDDRDLLILADFFRKNMGL